MPNNITNIIKIDAADSRIKQILEEIKDDEIGIGSIDFNKIIPMPDNIFKGNLGVHEFEQYGTNNWYDWSIKKLG